MIFFFKFDFPILMESLGLVPFNVVIQFLRHVFWNEIWTCLGRTNWPPTGFGLHKHGCLVLRWGLSDLLQGGLEFKLPWKRLKGSVDEDINDYQGFLKTGALFSFQEVRHHHFFHRLWHKNSRGTRGWEGNISIDAMHGRFKGTNFCHHMLSVSWRMSANSSTKTPGSCHTWTACLFL